MKRVVFIGLLIIFYVFLYKSVSAESGCGGTEFCQSTKIVGDYECKIIQGACQRQQAGTTTIDCTVTEDECYGYDRTVTDCTGGCYPITQNKKVSCCSGAGGGGFECDNPELEWVCLRAGECPELFEGPTCAPGKKWCATLTCPACTAVAPANILIVNPSNSSAIISWTSGTGGLDPIDERLYVCSNSDYTNCVVNGTTETSPKTVTGLATGSFYYVKVVNYKDTACSAETTSKFLSSCDLTPISATLNPTETQVFSSDLKASTENPTVTFASTDTEVATVSPTTGATQTTATAISVGDTNINVDVTVGGTSYCTDTSPLTVLASGPWWQVIDGDVLTNGSIGSDVPSSNYFDLDGAGGFPGVPIYGTSFNLSSTPDLISTKMWNANSITSFSRRFDYNYFEDLVQSDIFGTTDLDGYEWIKNIGPTTLEATNYSNRKVILFVDGNLTINGNITLDDGECFFGVFVSGDIIISPTVTSLEGLYLTDTGFETGSLGPDLDAPLLVRGSVASYGGMSLQRDLADDSSPAEIFEFAPDQLLLFPESLGYSRTRWTEVAP
ncbi:hypothetical protein A2366_03955 [Candidatus Woesebacteria bacterium RIFOXYB1_FULL_33_9]|nr:MAG: hypothetical protein A2366_03955 [Candidatus Woesebacteria bacterium RIFOXYB1_FULL_33_9]